MMMPEKMLILIFLVTFSLVSAVEVTISQPGIYVLGESIASLPVASDSIVNITVSDVVFDLGGYVIVQNNATAGVDGIVVNSGLSDIAIQNGVIRNVTSEGILINQACSRISIKNISFQSCAGRGIAFIGAAGVNQIRDCEITGCRFLACCNAASADSVMFLLSTIFTQVSDCVIANTVGVATLSLLSVVNCIGCDFSNITIQNNSTISMDIVSITSSSGNIFTNCIARSNVASGLLVCFDLTSSVNNIFNFCEVLFNRSTANQCTGFNIIGSSNNNLFNQCRVGSCIGTTAFSGFTINATTQISLIDCLVTDNSATGAGARCIGYLLNNANFCTFLRCLASYNSSTASLAIGLLLEIAGNRNNAIIDCFFSRNLGSSAANSRGVTIAVGANNLFTRNISFNNNTTAGNQFLGLVIGSLTAPGAPATNNLAGVTAAWTNMAIGS